jgi:hypothetical protein
LAPLQVTTQAPAAQACPLLQAAPQPPQQLSWLEPQAARPEELPPLLAPLEEPEPACELLQAAAAANARSNQTVFIVDLAAMAIMAGSTRPIPGPRGRAITKQSRSSQMAM